jgi:outer membrane receptor for ferrienterochelin and colicins
MREKSSQVDSRRWGKSLRPSRLRFVVASLLTVGLLFACAARQADAAQGQTGTIRVEVFAAGMPVEEATVSANGVSAATNAAGFATLTLTAGSVSIVATKAGYQQAAARVDVVAGAERTVRLVIAPAGQEGETVVSSTRARRRIDDQAVPVDVIGRSQIEAAMLRAPGDIVKSFNGIPGVRVQTTSPVLGTTVVRLRGLPGRYTRLLSDGVHLYGDRPLGYALLRIPPMDLDHVEVIKGPASAFYGSDSAGGSVNLVSRRPLKEPIREILFSQSTRNSTDGVVFLSSPATGTWSHTFLLDAHRQEEADVDDDGWSDIPGYSRGAVRERVFWDNGRGRSVSGVAGVTFEKRKGGSTFAREAMETKTADGGLSGQMVLDSGYILGGDGALFVQSRTRDFIDGREGDRYQTATIELTIRRPTPRHTWVAGIASDWYANRSRDPVRSKYVSTRPGMFVHDDWMATPWLLLSGSARLDHHNLYDFLLSPRGSALVRRGPWSARVSASQGYFTPRTINEETEAAGQARLSIVSPLELETARSASADFAYTRRAAALTLTVFRTQIDDPAQVDRATYTLRTEPEPIVSEGVEILGIARRPPFSVTGTYTYVRARERGGRDIALTPRHSAGLIAAAAGNRGRLGLEVLFTGEQRLDANPYRSTSEPYVVVGLLGERRFGRWRLFVNADNLTDVRQTHWDPIARPARDVDGRWTVDAWAPLEGRVVNAGIRVSF